MLDPIIEQKMDKIAEEIFDTAHDPTQIPITKESGEKLERLTPNWIKYRLDKEGNPIAWVIVVPTTKALAERFIKGKITEKQLLDLTAPAEKYSAIYLCEAITLPEYRRQGLSMKLAEEAIKDIPKTSDYILFVWPYSREGCLWVERLERLLGVEIKAKK